MTRHTTLPMGSWERNAFFPGPTDDLITHFPCRFDFRLKRGMHFMHLEL